LYTSTPTVMVLDVSPRSVDAVVFTALSGGTIPDALEWTVQATTIMAAIHTTAGRLTGVD
jgi:hypothetical protein